MSPPPTILIAARDEEATIAETISALRRELPGSPVVVADDGSRDRTAVVAQAAGARVVRLPRRGKGQALTLAEREAPPGPLLLCDADVRGALDQLLTTGADLTVAAFAERRGGGFGIAKRTAGALIRLRTGFEASEPLSGQRALSEEARRACFPLAAGFGCEVGMTLDVLRAGLALREVELPLEHRATRRDAAGFAHRGRQLLDALLALGPQGINHRGLRLPLVGWILGVTLGGPAAAGIATTGLADDLWSGPERGLRAHLRARRTTGMLKLLAIPAIGLAATRKLSAALLVALAANFWNQLDTRPGRALKAYLLVAVPLRAPLLPAAVLLPCDCREQTMLGDAGSNVLGGLLGLRSVGRLTGRGRWIAIGALASLNILGEARSLGELIERTPLLRELDGLGRQP